MALLQSTIASLMLSYCGPWILELGSWNLDLGFFGSWILLGSWIDVRLCCLYDYIWDFPRLILVLKVDSCVLDQQQIITMKITKRAQLKEKMKSSI